jgi:hypothetical protein
MHEGGFIGTPPAIVDRIASLRERGFSHFVFFTVDRGGPSLELFADQVLPAFS